MSIDEYFFTQDNFDFLKDAIVKEVRNRYKYDMGNQIDDNIRKIMEFVFNKVGQTPPRGTDLNKFLNMMNQKVYELIINRMKTKLEGSPEDMLEARRMERSQIPPPNDAVQTNMQLMGTESISGPRVIEEPSLIEEVDEDNDDMINSFHAESTVWVPPSDPVEEPDYRPPDQVDIPTQNRTNITKYLTIDSRFRHISLDKQANTFTVQFPAPVDLVSLECIDMIAPKCSSRYLFLKIDQLNGDYYENDIFAKLVPTTNSDSYLPSIKNKVHFGYPQRLQELTFRLLTPNRLPYQINDVINVAKFEKARSGKVQVVLEQPIKDVGTHISLYQLLKPGYVDIASQEFTYRMQPNNSAWIYGNFGEVTPKNGDLVRLTLKEGDSPQEYFRALDGQDNGAVLLEGVDEEHLKNLTSCTFICYSDGIRDEWNTSGIFTDVEVIKVYKSGNLVDKIEVDYNFEDLTDRDHLGERKIMIEALQTCYTFKMELRV